MKLVITRDDTAVPFDATELDAHIRGLTQPMLSRVPDYMRPPEHATLHISVANEEHQVEAERKGSAHYFISIPAFTVSKDNPALAQAALAHGLAHAVLDPATHYLRSPTWQNMLSGNQGAERKAARLALALHPVAQDHIAYVKKTYERMEYEASHMLDVLASTRFSHITRTHPHPGSMIKLIVDEAEALNIPVPATCLADLPPKLTRMIRDRVPQLVA